MPDMPCPKCGEPWDTDHVRNDAFDGDPDYDGRENMPLGLQIIYDVWQDFDPYSGTGEEKIARDDLGFAYYKTGLAHGCTSCWNDPSRIATDPDEQMRILREAVFDSAWDGDPAEILGAW